MSDLREIVKIINQIAIDNSESNSKEGEVVKLNDDGSHNIKLTEENGVEYIIQNRWPDDGKSKYPEGTRVIMTLPDGSLDRSVIRGNANFTLPSSPTVKHFSTAPIVPPVPVTGTIYLACPTENKIKQYSLSGTAGTDIVTNSGSQHNIVTDGTYFYFSTPFAYRASRIKIDGTEEEEIILQSRYYNAYGLAMNPAGTHLYTAYDIWYERYGIASIDISTGEVEETELSELSGEVTDICSDENYIYVLCRKNGDYYSSIVQYNYSLEFVTEINTGSYYDLRLEKDENYFYAANSDGIDIFTIAGVFVRRISENGIRAVAVKDGKIYVVVSTGKVKKYNSSGVFQSEFEIEGTVEDAVII